MNPKTYIITLMGHAPSETTGLSAVAFAKEYGWIVEIYPAVNGWKIPDTVWEDNGLKWSYEHTKPGIKGCFLSHWQLWNRCIELNEPIVVLEQDAEIQGSWLPDLVCGEVYKLHTVYETKNCSIVGNVSWSSHAYYITPTGATKLVEFAKQHGAMAVDMFIGDKIVDLRHAKATLVERANKFSTTQSDTLNQ